MVAQAGVGEAVGQQPEDAQGGEQGVRAGVGEAQAGHAGAGIGDDRGGDGGQVGGSVDRVVAEFPAASGRRLAVKPFCRSAGRLVSRLPIRKSQVSLMVVSVRRARPSLWYCLILAFL